MKKIAIIDAMALAYKAYYAFMSRPLSTKSGEPTSAVYGFVTQLLKILEDIKPEYLAVAFDSKEKTFRHEMYDKYKHSRLEMPDDMIPQIGRIREIVEALDIPVLIKPGYEADDIAGTIAKIAEAEKLEAYLVTPDKDYVQLVTTSTKIVKPGRSTDEMTIIGIDEVKEKYGFEPQYMIDYLALIGDSSDDIPGVKGIGPKTAEPLIKEYGTLENIYNNIDKITSKSVVKKLTEQKEMAELSKRLVTIALDVPMEFELESMTIHKPDLAAVKELFAELEFKTPLIKILSLFSEVKESEVDELLMEDEAFDKKKVSYTLIRDKKNAEKLAEKLMKQKIFVFDTETDSLDVLNVHIAGVSFCCKEKEAYYVALNPFTESEDLFATGLEDRLPLDVFTEIFKPVFENDAIKKVCQNGKYDIAVLRSNGIEVNNFYFDTMIASYVIDPDEKHGLDYQSEKFLHYTPIPLSDLIGKKKDPSQIFQVDAERLSDYACEDADITFRLYHILEKKLKEAKLDELAYTVEFPLVEVLENMEREGIRVDRERLREFGNDLDILLTEYTRTIYNLAGEEFNINSPAQLQVILFDKLNLTPGKKTKTGYSTDAATLENLRSDHEIVQALLNYRGVSKLKSTYVDALQQLINKRTGRVHTSFNQTVASTGRLSSNEPNLQNIPIRTEMGKEIRKAFVPRDKNYVILSMDYSQIELRIMASLSGDDNLIEAFRNNEDIHRSTAARVFKVAAEDVTPDMRRKAKEVNFGIMYGLGPFGLKTRLGISQSEAKEIIDTYFATFEKVRGFIDSTIESAKEKGYAETLLGRRRYMKNINSKNPTVRQFEERAAVNMPIQGTAADMIKIAMIRVHHELLKMKAKTKMVLQVHDELLFDAHKDEIDELIPQLKEYMETAMKLDVPIVAETGAGDNWLEAH